ncbi:hypothetical protein [Stygiobacter electus]|uniref:Germination protein, Ger(X)C family n=1 Tax=Stygiobacter electus TaxID=3032292 RepID=A0AAE3TC10_9BACT|nr:hypothetical protein [Stygiobacter electus]MDF1611923.1 hypothetical protein [Stygiobacter electus]
MKKLIYILLMLFIVSCANKKDVKSILNVNYEQYVLSIENPKIKVNLGKIDKNIILLLHYRIDEQEIKKQLKLNDSLWNDKINYLFGNGFIKKKDEKFIPSIFILDEDTDKDLKKFTDSLGNELSIITVDRLDKIKEATNKIFQSKNYQFDDISFFVLGAVVNDYFQIKNFQNEFIKSFVPQRGEQRFYYALISNEINNNEQPKIYETTFYEYPKFDFITFSLNKFDYNIPTFPTSDLINSFGKKPQVGDSIFQLHLIEEIYKLSTTPDYKPNKNILEGFEKLGITNKYKLKIPLIDSKKLKDLNNICEATKTDLINYFETRQTLFLKKYLNSNFVDEVNYKEWMIWIYKMISAKAIQTLIDKNIIKKGIASPALIVIK